MARRRLRFRMISAWVTRRWRLGAAGSYPAFCGLICWVGRWLRGEDFFGGCWRGVPGFSSPIRLPMLRLGACE